MKKGQLITGTLCGFTYVGKEVSYCKISVKDSKGVIHRGLAGTAVIFNFATMLSMRGADAPVSMVYSGKDTVNNVEYDQYSDVTFVL